VWTTVAADLAARGEEALSSGPLHTASWALRWPPVRRAAQVA